MRFFETPKGISDGEMQYRLKVQELSREKLDLIYEIQLLDNKLIYFKDEIIKNNATVDSASIEQLDSMFTAYFNR